jgi:hypothetical protein
MDKTQVIIALITGVGGLIASWFSFRTGQRQNKTTSYEVADLRIQNLINRLEAEVLRKDEEINSLRTMAEGLRLSCLRLIMALRDHDPETADRISKEML